MGGRELAGAGIALAALGLAVSAAAAAARARAQQGAAVLAAVGAVVPGFPVVLEATAL
jgi:hypothetical protein